MYVCNRWRERGDKCTLLESKVIICATAPKLYCGAGGGGADERVTSPSRWRADYRPETSEQNENKM
jgi:hypothetical protein